MSEPAGPERPTPAIHLASQANFAIGHVLVRPLACEIVNRGSAQRLEPRAMQVLVALARANGEVVTRDQLIDLCWEGRVVGEASITRCVVALRKVARSCGGALEIETLSKVGYRLVRSASAYDERDVLLGRDAADVATATPEPLTRAPWRKPSIAVLPFLNLSSDPDQDYFAEGVTEDIITALSRFRELLTAPRSLSFAFKVSEVPAQEIARRLGVEYLLTGSIRKSGSRVRVTAELTHRETDAPVWRERYDRELTDIFELQDDLSRKVAAVALAAVQGVEVARARCKIVGDLTAYDLYLRALPHMWAGTKEVMPGAIALLRQSLEHDGASVAALSALAWCLILAAPLGAAPRDEVLPEALKLAGKAIELDEADALAQAVYGVAIAIVSSEYDQAVLHAEEAVRLNPNLPFAWGALGIASQFAGHFERALDSLDLATRLGADPAQYLYHVFEAAACFALENYDGGVGAARRAIQRNPNYGTAHRLLAANLVLSQRIGEARDATRKRDAVQRTTLRELRAMKLFAQHAIMERYLDAQRLCGVEDE